MAELRDSALLLRCIPFRESSLIAHLLTAKHGHISLLARGARRKKSSIRSELAPLHPLKLRWQQRRTGMGIVLEIERGATLLADHHLLAGQRLLAMGNELFCQPDGTGYHELCQAFALLKDRPDEKHDFNQQHQPLWINGALHCSACDTGSPLGGCPRIERPTAKPPFWS